jgi:hypothetical protein
VAPGNGYFVNAYAPGAICRAATSGSGTTTVPVYDGSVVVANEYLMLGLDTTKVYKVITGTTGASGAQTIVLDGTIGTISVNNTLINLGKDIGMQSGGPPSYTQNGTPNAVIYTTPNTSGPITNSVVTCDSSGDYSYYYAISTAIWELVRNTAGTPIMYLVQSANAGLTANGVGATNEVVRWNDTSGLILAEGMTSNAVTISDAGAISAPGTHALGPTNVTGAITGSTTLTLTGIATVGGLTTAGNIATTGSGTLTVAGASTLAAVTASGAVTATGLATLNGGLKTAHIDASVGNTPTGAIVSGWGTTGSPTASISGTDTRCTATVTAGTGTPANPAIFTVTFASAYGATPHVMVVQNVLTGGSNGSVSTGGVTWTASQSAITISMLMAPTVSKIYTFEIFVIA